MGPGHPTDTSSPQAGSPQASPPARDLARGLEALLDFYLEAGVDVWTGEAAADAFALSEATQNQAQTQTQTQPRPSDALSRAPAASQRAVAPSAARQAPAQLAGHAGSQAPLQAAGQGAAGLPALPTDATVESAREAAASAQSLEDLRAILSRFEGCNLRLTAKSLVFGDGNPQGRVMFVGEAPGREEDRQGVPFVGRSGQLLDKMMAAIGLDRSGAWITNVVPWRPPGNRTPSPQETEICKPFVMRQIELVRPQVLVFLGGASAATLAGATEGILRLRGRWLEVPLRGEAGGGAIRALATLHPAYLLRNPLQKRLAWRDFLSIRAALGDGAAE